MCLLELGSNFSDGVRTRLIQVGYKAYFFSRQSCPNLNSQSCVSYPLAREGHLLDQNFGLDRFCLVAQFSGCLFFHLRTASAFSIGWFDPFWRWSLGNSSLLREDFCRNLRTWQARIKLDFASVVFRICPDNTAYSWWCSCQWKESVLWLLRAFVLSLGLFWFSAWPSLQLHSRWNRSYFSWMLFYRCRRLWSSFS